MKKQLWVLSSMTLLVVMLFSLSAFATGAQMYFSPDKNLSETTGFAFVAVCADATAMVWNPAGMVQLDDTHFAGTLTEFDGLGITHQFVGEMAYFANLGIGLDWERASIDGQFVEAGSTRGEFFTWVETITGSLATDVLVRAGLLEIEVATGDFVSVICIELMDPSFAGITLLAVDGSLFLDLADGVLQETRTQIDDQTWFWSGAGLDQFEFQATDELALRGGVVLTNNFHEEFGVIHVDEAYGRSQLLDTTTTMYIRDVLVAYYLDQADGVVINSQVTPELTTTSMNSNLRGL
jgi:hypothetical protein